MYSEPEFVERTVEREPVLQMSLLHHPKNQFFEQRSDDGCRHEQYHEETGIRGLLEHFNQGMRAWLPEIDQQSLDRINWRGEHYEADQPETEIGPDIGPRP